MRLYEIANEYIEAFNEIDNDESGVITEESIEKHLALIKAENNLENKCKNIGYYISNIEAEYLAVEEACKKMQQRKDILEKKIKSIKEYLLNNMLNCGLTKISCPEFVISLKKNPAKAEIINVDALDDFYKSETKEIKIDKKSILEALKAGLPVEGAELVQNFRVEIK